MCTPLEIETSYITAGGFDRYLLHSSEDSKSVCRYTKDGISFEFHNDWNTSKVIYLRNGQPTTKEEYLKFVCGNL